MISEEIGLGVISIAAFVFVGIAVYISTGDGWLGGAASGAIWVLAPWKPYSR